MTQRNGGLDAIRAAGAFLVFATHLYHSFGQTWLGPVAAGGFVGIFLFFPLSGYLLYRPFVEGRVDLRRYAVARIARLAPAYYLALFASMALGIVPGIVANPLPSLTFTNNLFPLTEIYGFGQSWTLGVEVAFYASLPFLAAGATRLGWPLLALVALSYGFSLGAPDFWWYQLPLLFFAFGAGMLVARYQDRLAPLARLWPLGLALVGWGILQAAGNERGNDDVTLGAAILILWAAVRRPSMAWARWPADISYGVYLWHVAVVTLLVRLGLDGPLLVPVAVVATVGVAAASWMLLEQPILRLAHHRQSVRSDPGFHLRGHVAELEPREDVDAAGAQRLRRQDAPVAVARP